MYVLRTAPCFQSKSLESYDSLCEMILGSVTNTLLEASGQYGACKQRSWDGVRAALAADRLLGGAGNDEECARLLSVSTKESGAWLRALPVSTLGPRMDDSTVRVAVGLRLGTAVCGPHSCQRCGDAVDALGRHALSCNRSEGRHQWHAAINAIVKNGLVSAHIPSRLEPTGLMRSDG